MTQTLSKTINKTALITGYTGQDGTFLTKFLLEKGYTVLGMVRRVSTEPPHRVRGKFDFGDYLVTNQLRLVEGDLLSVSSLLSIINQYQPEEIYNLAAQSHVGVSFRQPEFTIESNFMGLVNLVTALEMSRNTLNWRLYQASTSEMFGDVTRAVVDGREVDFNELSILNPNSPYAIAKTAAHHFCRIKRDQGRFISCGILFNHESEIRGGDFVTQKIARAVAAFHNALAEGKELPLLKLGNLEARRDWGYAGDYVKAMHAMLQQAKAEDFVIGSGKAHSVREFVEAAFKAIGQEVKWQHQGTPDEAGWIDGRLAVVVDPQFYRPNDVNFLKGDAGKARQQLDWSPEVTFEELVSLMVNAQIERSK